MCRHLSSISTNVIYDADSPENIYLLPLRKCSKLISTKDFYHQLCQDAERGRKLKKNEMNFQVFTS